jgi:hypothetical protein
MRRRYLGAGVALEMVCHFGVRLVNIHTRLVGAIDAVVLSLTAAITVAMLFVLLSPPVDRDGLAGHYTVTIEQLS